jgi:hypothetical protein
MALYLTQPTPLTNSAGNHRLDTGKSETVIIITVASVPRHHGS